MRISTKVEVSRSSRLKNYGQALNEALDMCLANDPSVFVIGEGVPDPKGIFGATTGLQKKYGENRVMDMPLSENAVTGVCIGAAIHGMRPVLTHQRIDFSLLALDQVVNSAAKWHYMFGGLQSVPLVIKMTIGMGWGQGPQHSQSLQALYAHIPGLKVVMPSSPHDAKGLMIASIQDNNPVVFIDHRWLHNTFGEVPEEYYTVPIGSAKVAKTGKDITIVTASYMTLESLRAAVLLDEVGINAEVVDVRTLRPMDYDTIMKSVSKTGRVLAVDSGHSEFGFTSEIIAAVSENLFSSLLSPPRRINPPSLPVPATPALAEHYYPQYTDIALGACKMFGRNDDFKKLSSLVEREIKERKFPCDVPDESFVGPF